MQGRRYPWLTIGLILVWVGLLVYLATLPRLPTPPGVSYRLASAAAHLGTHGFLAFLLFLALGGSSGATARGRVLRVAVAAASLSLALALVLETMQYFSARRTAEVPDLFMGGLGAATGAAFGVVLARLHVPVGWLRAGAAVVVLGFVVLTAATMTVWDPTLPRVGDHWHARFRIVICGTLLPPLRGAQGGVHTHGHGLIHVHPTREEEAGANANLALVLATSGGALTEDSLRLPSGETHVNGDPCPGGEPSRLVLWINGERVTPISTYVPQPGDIITLSFEPSVEKP